MKKLKKITAEDILLFLSDVIDLDKLCQQHEEKLPYWEDTPSVVIVPQRILSNPDKAKASYDWFFNCIFLTKRTLAERYEEDGEVVYFTWIPHLIEVFSHESIHWVLLKLFDGNPEVTDMFDNIYCEVFREYYSEMGKENDRFHEIVLDSWYTEEGELKFPEEQPRILSH